MYESQASPMLQEKFPWSKVPPSIVPRRLSQRSQNRKTRPGTMTQTFFIAEPWGQGHLVRSVVCQLASWTDLGFTCSSRVEGVSALGDQMKCSWKPRASYRSWMLGIFWFVHCFLCYSLSLLRYSWYPSCTYLMHTMWWVWTDAYAHEAITTIRVMATSITLKSVLVLLLLSLFYKNTAWDLAS